MFPVDFRTLFSNGHDLLVKAVKFKTVSYLNHQFIEPFYRNSASVQLFNYIPYPFARQTVLFSKTPEYTSFKLLKLLQETHQTPVIAAIPNHNRCVIFENLGKLPCITIRHLFYILFGVFRGKQKIMVNLDNERAGNNRFDKMRQRFVSDHERLFLRINKQGVFGQAVKIRSNNNIMRCFTENLRKN